jgi:hypothetical protein
MDETLVPYDFEWTPETSVTDDQIFLQYSQLPYQTNLVMMFDCCHSGGIHRAGCAKARGIEPPDDIRHRALRWNAEISMWEPRELRDINRNFTSNKDVEKQFMGENGSTYRLGRAMALRPMSEAEYKRASRERKQHIGPFLPVIIEACQEAEYAYEYRHGVTSYGAFTFAMATVLRKRRRISFGDLTLETAKHLAYLGYDQKPQILGPKAVVRSQVPWTLKRRRSET